MALSANTPRAYQVGDNESYPVAASVTVYEGAAIGENASGYARPLTAGDVFLGFAIEPVASQSSAGAARVEVKTRGRVQLAISSIAVTANDRPPVYASDDGTFTLTASTNSLIGYVSRWVSTGVAIVEFDAALVRAALQA